MQQLKDNKIDRCYFRQKPYSVDLHVSSDASLEAMCLVAYLRAVIDSGVEVSFVIRKCRIASLKMKTVPKLELQTALYAVRLRKLILEGHDIDIGKAYHWIDSSTKLQWLSFAQKKQQVYVANIGEMLHNWTGDDWRHVNGTMDPADFQMRGIAASQLLETDWLTGLARFRIPPETWLELKEQRKREKVGLFV